MTNFTTFLVSNIYIVPIAIQDTFDDDRGVAAFGVGCGPKSL